MNLFNSVTTVDPTPTPAVEEEEEDDSTTTNSEDTSNLSVL